MAKQKAAQGKCTKCERTFTRAGMARHSAGCWGAGSALHVRVRAAHGPWWLDVALSKTATLADLDAFLRATWLECCGHMSAFTIGSTRYEPTSYDYGWTDPARSMRENAHVALGPGTSFAYAYDFGTPTKLVGKVVGHIGGERRKVGLLARNEPPAWGCELCEGGRGDLICAYCGTIACAPCSAEKSCPECGESFDEMGLPVVDSPRMGVCGYVGDRAGG